MIAPDTYKNALDRNAWECGYRTATAHDKIPDSTRYRGDVKAIAAYWAGWNKGRDDKIKH